MNKNDRAGLWSVLFSVTVRGDPKSSETLFEDSRMGVIRHSGPYLGMEHFKVLKAIYFLWAKTCGSHRNTVKFYPSELLRLIGSDYTGSDRRSHLTGLLKDLTATRIEVERNRLHLKDSLFSSYEYGLEGTRNVTIEINPRVAAILFGSTEPERELARARSFGRHYFAMWLTNYFSEVRLSGSGEQLHTLNVDRLRRDSGTTVKSRSHFIQMLTDALNRAKSIDDPAISNWHFADSKKRELVVDFGSSEPQRRRIPRTPGYVYILTNPAMPGLIKIGKTRLSPTDRAAQLHTTGVPRGFQVEYACHTPDPEAVEQAMHVAFGPRRVNDRREFFEIEPAQAIAVLSLHHQAEPSTSIQ